MSLLWFGNIEQGEMYAIHSLEIRLGEPRQSRFIIQAVNLMLHFKFQSATHKTK